MENYENEEFVDGVQEEEESNYDAIMSRQSFSIDDLKEHMTGPVIAILIHAIILPFVIGMVINEPMEDQPEVQMETVTEEMVVPPPPPEPPTPPEPSESSTPSDQPADRPVIEAETEAVTEDDAVSLIEDQSMPEVSTAIAVRPNNSAKVLSGMYALRGGGKGGAVKKGGGGNAMQAGVSRALAWLAKVQNDDGSWGNNTQGKPGLTGLATLAFLAYGEMPNSPRYGKTVRNAIQRLVRYSHETNHKGMIPGSHGYGHAIATYAVSEAAAMTKLPEVTMAMNHLTYTIVSGQIPNGGFDYDYDSKSTRYDLSFAGWNYQALKAAFSAGADVPGLPAAIQRSINGCKLNYSRDSSGAFTYLPTGGNPLSITPVGVLCLQLLGDAQSSECIGGLRYMTSRPNLMGVSWKDKTYARGTWSAYAWYYQTQALFQAADGRKDEPNWKKWRTAFETALVAEQHADGYWNPAHKEQVYGGEHDSRVYTTALCCLMGEVYYRFLPSYKLASGNDALADKVKPTDDDLIKL